MLSCLKCQQPKPPESFRKANGKVMKWCEECRKSNGVLSRAGNDPLTYGNDYASRNRNVKRLGYATYAEYLRSDLWFLIRARVFAAKGRKCVACGLRANQVHHNRYHLNDLSGKNIKFLVPVCGACHERAEFDGEKKLTVRKAMKKLNHLKNTTAKPPQSVVVDFGSM